MLKFLVPLLFLTTAAFAQADEPGEAAPAPTGPPPKMMPAMPDDTVFAVNRTYFCNTGKVAYKNIVGEGGFKIMISFLSISDDLEMNQVMYNKEKNSVMVVRATFADHTYQTATRVCTVAYGLFPYANNDVMRDFVIGQILSSKQSEYDEGFKEHKDHNEKHGEPPPVNPHAPL